MIALLLALLGGHVVRRTVVELRPARTGAIGHTRLFLALRRAKAGR
jgi:hypothetical protein